MIVFKDKKSSMLDKLEQRLAALRVEDYEVNSEVPSDNPGIDATLDNPVIYVPQDLDYYEVEDQVHLITGHRTSLVSDRDLYRIEVKGRIGELMYVKLIQYLVKSYGFVTIVKEDA
mgnify:CR=1 FL=1